MPARNPVRQGAGEGAGERGGGEEDADAEAELVAEVEEGEEVRDAGAVAGFDGAEEKAKGHLAGPVGGGGLADGDDAPGEGDEAGPDVWGEDFPHEALGVVIKLDWVDVV